MAAGMTWQQLLQRTPGVSHQCVQVPDDALVERVSGRRLDPETGDIYHLTNKPPPKEIMHRLTQRSDDTEEKLRTRLQNHHDNVKSVVSYYSDMVAEVGLRLTVSNAVTLLASSMLPERCGGRCCSLASMLPRHKIACSLNLHSSWRLRAWL